MGVMGEMFPGPKILDEAGEAAGGGEGWRLGPLDFDTGVIEVQRAPDALPGPDDLERPDGTASIP